MEKTPTGRVLRGDPDLLDRLNRAMGAYLARTGKKVEDKELAAAAGLKPASMSDIRSLEKRVTIDEAKAFARYLGVNFAWLAIGEGPMRSDEGEGDQPARTSDAPKPTNGPTRRTVETQVQFLDPKQPTQKGRAPKIKRRPPGRSASA